MKKSVNVNLGGRVFQIDDDAYRMLDTYIQNIRALYQKEDPDGEIVEDFEQRLSDLLWEKKYGEEAVITVQMTEEAIRQLGPLEEIKADESFEEERFEAGAGSASAAGAGSATSSALGASEASFGQDTAWTRASERKKYFRNPDDKWISGVIGGLGALMGIDPLFLRVLFVLLMFTPVNWVLFLIYITFWIFIPKAVTVEDKLRMEGRPVSSSEIWNKITEEASFAAGAASDGLSRMSKAFGKKETFPEDAQKPKKKSSGDSLMYWVIGIAVLLVVVFSVYWLFDFVASGSFLYPETWDIDLLGLMGDPFTAGGIVMALMMALVAIIIAFAAIFILFVLPLGLIIRSNMNGGLKVVLCLIWLVLLGLAAL